MTRIIRISLDDIQRSTICIGHQDENEHVEVRFNIASFADFFPSLTVTDPHGTTYPVVLDRDGSDAVWTVTESDLVYSGRGEYQLTFVDGDHRAKTYIGKTKIDRSLAVTGKAPTPVEEWVDRANEKLAEVEKIVAVQTRLKSLTDTEIAAGNIVEAVGSPIYVDDVTRYSEYGITETGWYVLARVFAKDGTQVTEQTSIDGAAGAVIEIGADHVDVAVLFEVAAMGRKVTITWGDEIEESFIFRATDLAIRNLDYRVTFYVYDADEFATWSYALTTDATFVAGKNYYILDGEEYVLAEVTAGDPVPAGTYYVHSGVTFEGMTRNVTYRCNQIIDCPMTFILPEIEDDCHGAWFELRCQHAGSYSMTLVPPSADVKVATEHTQSETAGINMINLHYTSVNGVKIWRFMNTHSSIPA